MKTIVVLDDDKVVLSTAKMSLESAGYEVIATDSWAEVNGAIFRAPTNTIDLLVVDLTLPQCSGEEIVKIYRATPPPRQKKMKIVIYSATPESELEEIAHRCGADGFLTKGNGKALVESVAKYVQGPNGSASIYPKK